MSGSGSESLLKSFRESQTKSKTKERKKNIKKEEKMDEGSPVSTIGGLDLNLNHIPVVRDLKPSQEAILAVQERVGGSSMPPEIPAQEEEEEENGVDSWADVRYYSDISRDLKKDEEEVEIKAEDIRKEMSTKVSKAGKRKSVGVSAGVIEGSSEVMTRGKKARLSKATEGGDITLEHNTDMEVGSKVGPSTVTTTATTITTTTAVGGPSKPKRRVSFDNTEHQDWRAERSTALYSGATTSQTSLAGPSQSALEREVMYGIYANMADTSMADKTMDESMIEDGKGKSKGKGKGKEILPAGQVRCGRWRKK